jgi:dienelactone hydrolase
MGGRRRRGDRFDARDDGLSAVSLTVPPPTRRPSPPVGRGRPRLQRPLLSALIAGVVGVLATSGGAGVGIRHVQKNGLTLVSSAGLLTLAFGLALLVFAGVVLWRATRGWRKLWLAPAGVAVIVVLYAFTTAVMVVNVPRTALGSQTPATRGLAYADVSFPTSDGVRLSAWYVPSTNRAAVVLLHGAGENRTATLPQAAVLARHGYGVLLVDARGQGRSAGHGMDLGWYGDRDVGAAVTFLRTRSDVDPAKVAVLGLSMGGEEAIGAAGSDPRIAAVVAEGATVRTAADKDGWLPGGIAGALQRGLDRVSYAVIDVLTPASPPTALHDAIAAASGRPFLLIAAGRVADEARAATYFRSAAPDRVQVWKAPGASHTHALSALPHEWEARVTAFLGAALGVPT